MADFGPLTVLLGAVLNKRFGWTMAPNEESLALGRQTTLAGFTLRSRAMVNGPFFCGTVRIQTDRGQHVIDAGPSAWLRHPACAGVLLSCLGFALLLDS